MLKVVGAASCFQEALRRGLVARGVPDGWVRLRAAAAGVDDVALGWLSEGESAVFKALLRARAVARQACAQGCQSLFARAGLPWHDPISALPVSLLPCITGTTFWTSMHTGTLWYLKPYDFQAPGLPTTPSTHIDPE